MTFERLVATLVEAGVGMIQLRDKQLDDRELIGRARQLRQLTRGTATLCDHQRPGRYRGGGRRPMASTSARKICRVKDARAIVGTRMLIGVSTHNIEQARAAVLDGANYLGAGPTFPSQTKAFDEFAGLDYLREVAAEIRLPTFAIGGITADNLPDVLATGITRVAVGAAVTERDDPALRGARVVGYAEATPSATSQARPAEAASPS